MISKWGAGRRWHRAILAVASLLWTVPLAAQEMQPPPRHDARSPTGVSYHNGSFSFEEEDLSIGGGLPPGLSLVRSYNSSSDGFSYPFLVAGWTSSLNIYIAVNRLPAWPDEFYPSPPPSHLRQEQCIYNLVGGPRSTGFYLTAPDPAEVHGCGAPQPGTYTAAEKSGDTLEFIGAYTTGYFRYTGADGSVIKFMPVSAQAEYWIMADGTRLDFTYASEWGGQLKSVFSSLGWAILIESPSKVCAVNIAQTYVTPTSPCPADAQTVTYSYTPGTYVPGQNVLTSMTKGGATRTYGYDPGNDRLNCIIDPGQTGCKIRNTYAHCPENIEQTSPQPQVRRNDPVVSQLDGSGKAYQYELAVDPCPWWPYSSNEADYRPFNGRGAQVTETAVGGVAITVATTTRSAQLESIRDPLDRLSTFAYLPPTLSFGCCKGDFGALKQAFSPEVNSIEYVRNARGNVIAQIVRAKPGSGLANLVTTASYPATCTNVFTCNKPESVTDPRGNTASYTYWDAHGGVRRETGPPDATGIAPVKRYDYVQRRAWLKNSSGGYTPASWIWVLSTVKTCRTSATIGEACQAGLADEVVTTYDYGPDGGPNNLLLRGQTVTAIDGGVTTVLRTCFGNDRDGRKISETSPNANLASCP